MSPALVEWRRRGEYAYAYGRPRIFLGDFVLMETKPTPSNSGVPTGLALRTPQEASLPIDPATGDLTITDAVWAAGQVDGRFYVDRVNLPGFVKVRTGYPVYVIRSRVRGSRAIGGETRTALIDCNHSAVGSRGYLNVSVEQSTLIPDHPSEGIDGIVGSSYRAERCLVRDVVDHFGIFNNNRPADPARVQLFGNYADRLLRLNTSVQHSDGTHNDSMQAQGNDGVEIRGNTLLANTSPLGDVSPYEPSVTGQVIGITPNVSQVRNVLIEGNWLDYGAQSITVVPNSKGATDIRILRNKFGRNQPNLTKAGGTARRAILLDPRIGAPGMPSSTGFDLVNGNVWEDDGSPVAVYRFIDGVSTTGGQPPVATTADGFGTSFGTSFGG